VPGLYYLDHPNLHLQKWCCTTANVWLAHPLGLFFAGTYLVVGPVEPVRHRDVSSLGTRLEWDLDHARRYRNNGGEEAGQMKGANHVARAVDLALPSEQRPGLGAQEAGITWVPSSWAAGTATFIAR
jgi:hypothetical protein